MAGSIVHTIVASSGVEAGIIVGVIAITVVAIIFVSSASESSPSTSARC